MGRRSKLVILTSNLMRSIRTIETLILRDECFFAFRFSVFGFLCLVFCVLISISGFWLANDKAYTSREL